MFKQMKLKPKLLVAFLCVGIIPFVIIATFSLNKMSNSLSRQIFSQLVSIRDIKKNQVEQYMQTIKNQVITFSENFTIIEAMTKLGRTYDTFIEDNKWKSKDLMEQRNKLKTYYMEDFSNEYRNQNDNSTPNVGRLLEQLDDTAVAFQYNYIKANPNPLGSKDNLKRAHDASQYSKIHGQYHPVICNYLKKFGYYDIFLVHPKTGKIIYSVYKELDFATSLIDGPYANTGIGKAFRKANSSTVSNFVAFIDFEQYFPSYEAPAGFVSSPIYYNQQKVGILIFQFPLDNLNAIMKSRTGMGNTGETYMVGEDMLMRSDSYLDPDNHSVVASIRHPEKGKVNTSSVYSALKHETGYMVTTNYKGNRVLSAYAPLNFSELKWVFIAEKSESEAFNCINTLKKACGIVGIICFIAIVCLSLFIAVSIVNPIQGVVKILTELSQGEGDLTTRLPVTSNDEMGDLSRQFNSFMEKLKDMITNVVKGVETLSSSSSELSAISTQMSSNSEETSAKSSMVLKSAENMSGNMNSVSATMEQTSKSTNMVSSAAGEMTSTINDIAQNADKAREVSVDAVEESQKVRHKMSELGSAAKAIDQVTETITEISEQTNLLALNATIEAARAGDAGKGFAVVANEIKELARQTTNATLDIRNKIEGIQSVSTSTIKSIEKVANIIESINDVISTIASAVEEQTVSTKDIADNITQISYGVNEATKNVAQTSKVAEDITIDMNEVNYSSIDISNSSSQVNQSASELSKLAEQLNVLVSRFKI